MQLAFLHVISCNVVRYTLLTQGDHYPDTVIFPDLSWTLDITNTSRGALYHTSCKLRVKNNEI